MKMTFKIIKVGGIDKRASIDREGKKIKELNCGTLLTIGEREKRPC
jgi:hypothetical protein